MNLSLVVWNEFRHRDLCAGTGRDVDPALGSQIDKAGWFADAPRRQNFVEVGDLEVIDGFESGLIINAVNFEVEAEIVILKGL